MKTENFEEYFKDVDNVPDEESARLKRLTKLKKLTQKLKQLQPIPDKSGKRKHKHHGNPTNTDQTTIEEAGKNCEIVDEIDHENNTVLPMIEGVSPSRNSKGNMGKIRDTGQGICDSCAKVGMFSLEEALKRSLPVELEDINNEKLSKSTKKKKAKCIICKKYQDHVNPVFPEKKGTVAYSHDFYDKFSRDANNSRMPKIDDETIKPWIPDVENLTQGDTFDKLTRDVKHKVNRHGKIGPDGRVADPVESEKFLKSHHDIDIPLDNEEISDENTEKQKPIIASYVNDKFVMPTVDLRTNIKLSTMVLFEEPQKYVKAKNKADDSANDGEVNLTKEILEKLPDVKPMKKLLNDEMKVQKKEAISNDGDDAEESKEKGETIKETTRATKLHKTETKREAEQNTDQSREQKKDKQKHLVVPPINSYQFSPPGGAPDMNENNRGMRPRKKAQPSRKDDMLREENDRHTGVPVSPVRDKPYMPPANSMMVSPMLVPDMYEYEDDFHRNRGMRGGLVKRELNPIHSKRQELLRPKFTTFSVGELGLVYSLPGIQSERCGTSGTEPLPSSRRLSVLPPVKSKRPRPFSYV